MYKIKVGDCVESMKSLPDNSIQCCVTSPPYFNLRDYGIDGQIGRENSPKEYIAKLVEVLPETEFNKQNNHLTNLDFRLKQA